MVDILTGTGFLLGTLTSLVLLQDIRRSKCAKTVKLLGWLTLLFVLTLDIRFILMII